MLVQGWKWGQDYGFINNLLECLGAPKELSKLTFGVLEISPSAPFSKLRHEKASFFKTRAGKDIF